MRSRMFLLVVVIAAGLFVMPHLAHASIPFFGPIIPPPNVTGIPGSDTCPLGWGAVIVVINNIIELALTLIILFLAPIMIAYSGFLYVVNAVNPKGKEQAKAILTHTVVGLVIALGAWLIVSAFMSVLYHPDPKDGFIANWGSIISSNGFACLPQDGSVKISVPSGAEPALAVVPPAAPITRAASGGPSMSREAITNTAKAAAPYRTQVCEAARANGIQSQCDQLLGILGVESGGDKNAKNPVNGEIGLMQLKPTTAAQNGVASCAGSSDISPFQQCVAALQDVTTNINAGAKYYAAMYREFGGDQMNATAAYNAGDGRGRTADGKKQPFAPSADCPGSYAWQCPINPGGFAVTQSYVQNVAAVAAAVATQ